MRFSDSLFLFLNNFDQYWKQKDLDWDIIKYGNIEMLQQKFRKEKVQENRMLNCTKQTIDFMLSIHNISETKKFDFLHCEMDILFRGF